MHCVTEIKSDLFYVGVSDRRLALFENVFPIPRGVSYNSYLIKDEKTVLLDTVDRSVASQFFQNINYVLGERPLDYLIVNHMEPDHCATMAELVRRYPNVKIVANAKIVAMIKQFFDFDIDCRAVIVNEGETFSTGIHTFTFVMAPMVHWPEVMVTYDLTDKILFSADAFGTFGALNGNIFADEVDFEQEWLADARRYYTNIVGKYGVQVQKLLSKAAGLELKMVCPLHGPIWRSHVAWFVDKYEKWSSYTPELNSVLIVYASVYGNTENAVNIIATKLAAAGIKKIAMYDVSVTHPSEIVAEAFRYSHIVFAATTYNAGIFCNMETVLLDLKAHNLQNRTVAVVQNGSWAATSGDLMKKIFQSMRDITVLEPTVSIKSSLKEAQLVEVDALVAAIVASIVDKKQTKIVLDDVQMAKDKAIAAALMKVPYGLYILSANDGAKDNACIINTVMQLTDNPKQIAISVNKANLTHDMILKTSRLNVSVLTEDVPFDIIKRFGFQSGRTSNKFEGSDINTRTSNGLLYLDEYVNVALSAKVVKTQDTSTHTVFIAEVTDVVTLSEQASVTYDFYAREIKPKPAGTTKKKGFECEICGYVYEGDELPSDFICPLCKHGVDAFKPLA